MGRVLCIQKNVSEGNIRMMDSSDKIGAAYRIFYLRFPEENLHYQSVPVHPSPASPRHTTYLFLISNQHQHPPPPSTAKQPLLSPITPTCCGGPQHNHLPGRAQVYCYGYQDADMRQNIFTSYRGKYFYDSAHLPPVNLTDNNSNYPVIVLCNFRLYSTFLSPTTMKQF